MDDYLTLCLACRRHVRPGTERCPFCAAATPSRSARRAPTRRLSRPGILAFGAAMSASVAFGCGSSHEPEDDAGRTMVDAGPADMDAGPGGSDAGPGGTDAGPDGSDAGQDAGFDAGQLAMPYGAPPMRDGWV